VIDYFLYIDFFRCAARLVVTIYDLLLASILGICGSDASVAYPIPFTQQPNVDLGLEDGCMCISACMNSIYLSPTKDTREIQTDS